MEQENQGDLGTFKSWQHPEVTHVQLVRLLVFLFLGTSSHPNFFYVLVKKLSTAIVNVRKQIGTGIKTIILRTEIIEVTVIEAAR